MTPRAEAAAPDRAHRESPQTSDSLWRDDWPEFSVAEGVATTTAGVGSLLLFLWGPVVEPRWRGGVLFDDDVRDALRAESESGRDTFQLVGDVTYYSAPILPLLVDPFVVALAGRGDGKLAKNLALMSLESFSYSGFASLAATQVSARERPAVTECLRSGQDDQICELDSRTEAFWSGHTTISATAAGLVCANHAYVPLWGHPAADAWACIIASANAATTGLTRLSADQHYATDVLVGGAMGFMVGYAIPTLLHYTAGSSASSTIAVAPFASGSARGLSVTGAF